MRTFLTLSIAALALSCAAKTCAAQEYLDIRRYSNTYEINVIPGKPPQPGDGIAEREMNKCQAVRLNKEWFITAAHCVQGACGGYSGCTVQARLIVGDNYEMVWQVYSSGLSSGVIKIDSNSEAIANDIALIRFADGEARHIYTIDNYIVSQKIFLERTNLYQSDINHALNGGNFPTLLLLKAETAKILNRRLAIPSIWGGRAEVLGSHGPVYYSPKKRYLFTDNFGVRGGVSGSGVFTSSGELVGIVSATGNLRRGAADGDLNYTFLTVFDEDMLNFIRRNAGRIETKTPDIKDGYMSAIMEEETRQHVFAVEEAVT